MSTHKECGEPIHWAKLERDHERFLPPLEFAGEGFILDADRVGIKVQVYREHVCDPKKVRAWQKRVTDLVNLGVRDPSQGRAAVVNYETGEIDDDEGLPHTSSIKSNEQIKAEIEERERRDEKYEAMRQARNQINRDRANKPALLEDCPTCHKPAGEMCISMSKHKTQAGKTNKYVHPARQELAHKNGRYPEVEKTL